LAFPLKVVPLEKKAGKMGSKRNGRVLLVDDEPDLLEILSQGLASRGIDCFTAKDGREALELIQSERPAVILSDYSMPKLNGMELLKFLGDLKIHIPVIWLTGNADQATFREAWRVGVYDFFEKPFKIEEIAAQVAVAMELTPEEVLNRRPKFLNERYFKSVNVDFEIQTFDLLKEHCLRNSISISHFISKIVVETLDDVDKK
jgi:DNA-binding NtrC family response regulator